MVHVHRHAQTTTTDPTHRSAVPAVCADEEDDTVINTIPGIKIPNPMLQNAHNQTHIHRWVSISYPNDCT